MVLSCQQMRIGKLEQKKRSKENPKQSAGRRPAHRCCPVARPSFGFGRLPRNKNSTVAVSWNVSIVRRSSDTTYCVCVWVLNCMMEAMWPGWWSKSDTICVPSAWASQYGCQCESLCLWEDSTSIWTACCVCVCVQEWEKECKLYWCWSFHVETELMPQGGFQQEGEKCTLANNFSSSYISRKIIWLIYPFSMSFFCVKQWHYLFSGICFPVPFLCFYFFYFFKWNYFLFWAGAFGKPK